MKWFKLREGLGKATPGFQEIPAWTQSKAGPWQGADREWVVVCPTHSWTACSPAPAPSICLLVPPSPRDAGCWLQPTLPLAEDEPGGGKSGPWAQRPAGTVEGTGSAERQDKSLTAEGEEQVEDPLKDAAGRCGGLASRVAESEESLRVGRAGPGPGEGAHRKEGAGLEEGHSFLESGRMGALESRDGGEMAHQSPDMLPSLSFLTY